MEKQTVVNFRGKQHRVSIQIILAPRYDASRETPKDGSVEHLEERQFFAILSDVAGKLIPIAEEQIKVKMALDVK